MFLAEMIELVLNQISIKRSAKNKILTTLRSLFPKKNVMGEITRILSSSRNKKSIKALSKIIILLKNIQEDLDSLNETSF